MKLKAIAVGTSFGRLTLLEHLPPPKYGAKNHRGRFRCECGQERTIRISDVINGRSRSCGCYAKQVQRAANAAVYG